jgi:type VI secretion system protein ImpB
VTLNFKGMRDFEPLASRAGSGDAQAFAAQRRPRLLKGPGQYPAFRKAIEDVLADERQRGMIMKELGMSEAEVKSLLTAKEAGGETAETKPKGPQKKN